MLLKGTAISDIVDFIGLSENEIKELKKEIC